MTLLQNRLTWAFCLFTALLLASPVLAQSQIFEGLDKASQTAGLTGVNPYELVGRVITTILSLLGIVFLLILIYGGFLYMTAGGDNTKIQKATKLMVNAAIGTVIIVAAYAISVYVFGALVTTFS